MKEQIRAFIFKETFTDKNKIDDNTQLFDEGIFDSMGLLNLIAFIEENYKLKINDSELDVENFGSINAIASFIENKSK